MSNVRPSHKPSKSDTTTAFLLPQRMGRPLTKEIQRPPETFVFKNNHIVVAKKVSPLRGRPPTKEANRENKNVAQAITILKPGPIQEDTLEFHTSQQTIEEGNDELFNFNAKYGSPGNNGIPRANKFKTLNPRPLNQKNENTFHDLHLNSTMMPDEVSTLEIKSKANELIRNRSRIHDDYADETNFSNPLGKKKSQPDVQFPQINQPNRLTMDQKLVQIEAIYSTTPRKNKNSTATLIPKEAPRSKSNARNDIILNTKELKESGRRAFSNLRNQEEQRIDQNPFTRFFHKNDQNSKIDFNKTQLFAKRTKTNSGVFPIDLIQNRQKSPLNQSRPKSTFKAQTQKYIDPLREPSPPKMNRLHGSDVTFEERDNENKFYVNGSAGPSTLFMHEIHNHHLPKEPAVNSLSPASIRGITHHKTQPRLDEEEVPAHKPRGNKSIDTKLRDTVDSQHDISYVEKENPKIFLISPPFEGRQGKFVRTKKEGLKREDSNKNILDEFADKSVKISDENQLKSRERSVSKSPFDEFLETSMMSYEKDSIARSRTKKEIETIISTNKQSNFKRSRVVVLKQDQVSTEKLTNVTSTNMTNSKSTYKNESVQGLFHENSKKVDHLDTDFGFEDDLLTGKKHHNDKSPSVKEGRASVPRRMPLNVITEEPTGNQKETIQASLENKENEPDTPSSKVTTIKPLFSYHGHKLAKNENVGNYNKVNQSTLSQKLQEEDDICVNGETYEGEIYLHDQNKKTIENMMESSLTNI